MGASIPLLIASAVAFAAADRLSLYLSQHCTNANLGVTSPLPLGSCIEFGQAQSYILTKDTNDVYNLYSGGGCGNYEGQVSLSKTCLQVGDGITGLMNIGPQSSKLRIRGSTLPMELQAMEKRVDGDTYQCPNTRAPYFFVVQSSSAVHEELPDLATQSRVRNDFLTQFNNAYQTHSSQDEIRSFTRYGGEYIHDVYLTLDMEQGVASDFRPQDMIGLTDSLLYFRDLQRSPIRFMVSIYSGYVNGAHGLLGDFRFDGDD